MLTKKSRGSSFEGKDYNGFTFVRSITVSALALENRVSEAELSSLHAVAARNQYDREVKKCIEHEAPWSILCNKRESNLRPNQTITDA